MAQQSIPDMLRAIFAREGAEFPGDGKTGPGAPPSSGVPWPGEGPVAWKSRPGYDPGPAAVTPSLPWVKAFIPPLALYNDADQWVNRLAFVRPMPDQMNPGSGPLLGPQYVTARPIEQSAYAAGNLNLQLQLGQLAIQATRLQSASLYYGS